MTKTTSLFSKIIPSLACALVISSLQITFILAYAALVFGQSMPEYLNQGIGILLLGSVISIGVITALSSYEGSMGSAQDIPATLISVVIASIAGYYAGSNAPPEEAFHTSIAAMLTATAITGLLMLITAYFKLGKIIRFIPFPVIGGLLASTGWVLSIVALSLLTGEELKLGNLHQLVEPGLIVRWLPGLLIALLLIWVQTLTRAPLAMPLVLFSCAIAVHVWLQLSGTSINAAQTDGMLLNVSSENLPFGVNPLTAITQANWGLVWSQFPLILSLCFLSLVISMVQVSSIEVAIDQEINMDRELFANGVANTLISSIGGLIAYHHISETKLTTEFNAASRMTGLLVALFCLLPFFIGSGWLGYFPISVLGGIILYLGIDFLYEWLIKAARRLPVWEYLTIWVILLTVIFFDFTLGIAVGIFCGALLFLIRSSRVEAVRSIISGKACKSVVMRNAAQEEFLKGKAGSIVLVNLRGFLFFGSANNVYEQIKKNIEPNDHDLKHLVLDFKQVTNIDYSAVMGLSRIRRYLNQKSIHLLLSNVPVHDITLLKGALFGKGQSADFFATADLAIESAENILLEQGPRIQAQDNPIDKLLQGNRWSSNEIKTLRNSMTQRILKGGEFAMRAGEIGSSFFFIESGRLEIHQLRGGQIFRLRVLQPGTVIGEMGVYSSLPRSADVIAKGETVISELSAKQFQELEQNYSGVAIKLHRVLGARLSQMLIDDAELHALRV